MADKVVPGPVDSKASFKEAVCIHTHKVFDSCRDKDCIEDLRVYPTITSQTYIESAMSIRPRCAELLYVDVNVEEICFNRGYFTVDVTYYYRIRGEAYPSGNEIIGLSVFTKRVILYGSDGDVKVFSSAFDSVTGFRANQPIAVVEAVNPIILGLKVIDANCYCGGEADISEVPAFIIEALGEDIVLSTGNRILLVSLGQFSIVRLERDTQLLIPTYSYCFPDKECVGAPGCAEDPCTLFSKIPFPVDEFFPPDSSGDFNSTVDLSGCSSE